MKRLSKIYAPAPQEQDKFEHAKSNAVGWYASIEEMLADIDRPEHETNPIDHENAERTIQESVLSVLVRDGWRQAGGASEGAEEYEILLTTGGPALRIWGRLGQHDQPDTAELQMQDWGTPWVTWVPAKYDENYTSNLLKFASCFYFGD